MKNRQVYLKDPSDLQLLNNGVAAVSDERTAKEKQTLRYELETFVCEGGFETGLERILGAYLGSLNSPEQPGVWVSGFYGSGKSHLVKVLRALWVDEVFPEDQATARGITRLPDSISDHLKELSNRAKTHGGLHAASGTLGSGAGDHVRLALASIVFRSAGLPTDYSQARFVMWLKREGYLDAVRKHVEALGKSWDDELNNLLVATSIPQALLEVNPEFASDKKEARSLIRAQFAPVEDITNEQMIDVIREAIAGEDGQIPLTLIVLDEIQQYIGEDHNRSYQVQEIVESCNKKYEGQLLFVATGQSAIAGTPLLMKLKGRFTIPVQLSDSDVDTVVRQIVLAKKPEAKSDLKSILDDNVGEISKHLVGSKIGYQPADQDTAIADYPLLPVRRRFWERCLRAVDPSGTKAQLRNQLRVVHEAAKATADQELGCVVAGDYIYDQIAPDMLNTGELPKETYEKIQALKEGDDPLLPRIAALCFLIGKLPRDGASDLGVRATEQTLADLLVTDLRAGSGPIQKQLGAALDVLVGLGLLMPVGDEYLIQTQEGGAWLAEFMSQKSQVTGDPHRVTNDRDALLRESWRARLGNVKRLQGASKQPRKPELAFGDELPTDADQKLYVWARDGWDTDESSVKADALQAGTLSPTLFAFLPRRSAEDLKSAIVESRAADATLNARGTPSTPEGMEARSAMITRQKKAKQRIDEVIGQVFADVQVYSGGGQSIDGIDVVTKIERGLDASLARLFPKFDVGDHSNWSKVIVQAKGGSPNPLSAVGHAGNVNDHEVCVEILKFVGSGKSGSDIRSHFAGSPYGWPRDAIDGGIFGLAAGGHLRVQLNGQDVDIGGLTQGQVTKHSYKVVDAPITVKDRIRVRKLLQELVLPHTQGQELSASALVPPALMELADRAGGEAPRPERRATPDIEALKSMHGNDLLLALSQQQEQLLEKVQAWKEQGRSVDKRLPRWEKLKRLLEHADDLGEEAVELTAAAEAVQSGRQLLDDPDPVQDLYERAVQRFRGALVQAKGAYDETVSAEKKSLESDPSWAQLEAEQKKALLSSQGVDGGLTVKTATDEDVINSLESAPLRTWKDRTGALATRFGAIRLEAAKILQPKARPVSLPRRTLSDAAEVDAWIGEVQATLSEAVKDGPVVI